MHLARALRVEIVCCDSVQVYRGMDIGSGKPDARDRALVPHHLLDVVEPGEPFSAAAWAARAAAALDAIAGRRALPIVVGGTGLYFRALAGGLFDAPPADATIRARHRQEAARLGVPALHARLAEIDPAAAAKIRPQDLMRVSRALEVFEQTGVPISELRRRTSPARRLRFLIFVLDPPLAELRARVDARVDQMMRDGFLDEVRALRRRAPGGARSLGALGYRELGAHLDDATDLSAAVVAMKRATVAYARRQRTWFRSEAGARRIWPVDPAAVLDAVRAWLGG